MVDLFEAHAYAVCLSSLDVPRVEINVVPTLWYSMKRRWSLPGVSLGISCRRSSGRPDTRLRPGWEMAMLYLLPSFGPLSTRPQTRRRREPRARRTRDGQI